MLYQKFYKYLGMPNGYSYAMRVFTKMLKQLFAILRKQSFISVVFIDDSYLKRSIRGECLENVYKTVGLLTSLGFTIHKEKSVFRTNATHRVLRVYPKLCRLDCLNKPSKESNNYQKN